MGSWLTDFSGLADLGERGVLAIAFQKSQKTASMRARLRRPCRRRF